MAEEEVLVATTEVEGVAALVAMTEAEGRLFFHQIRKNKVGFPEELSFW